MPKKKSGKKDFFDLMVEVRDSSPDQVKEELSMEFGMSGSKGCPVPGCGSINTYSRWGDLYDHFLDTSHKRDYFNAFFEARHEPFGATRGPEFTHGVRSLMLALFQQPTALASLLKAKPVPVATTSTDAIRAKRAKPVQEQQSFDKMKAVLKAAVSLPEAEAEERTTKSLYETMKNQAVEKEENPAKGRSGKSNFSRLSEIVRDSDEINKIWRGEVWDKYVEQFHGFPPCFHCRETEANQIHHQNPLFSEIVLLSLKKLDLTADQVMEKEDSQDKSAVGQVIKEVFEFHMKPGRVCAVPYCKGCNQDAEIKRRAAKALKNK